MTRERCSRTTLALALAGVLAGAAALAQEPGRLAPKDSSTTCATPAPIGHKLLWPTSGAWTQAGDLLVVDELDQAIVALGTDGSAVRHGAGDSVFGRYTGEASADPASIISWLYDSPSHIAVNDDRSGRVGVFDRSLGHRFNLQAQGIETGSATDEPYTVGRIYSGDILENGHVVTYAQLRGTGEANRDRWIAAFTQIGKDGVEAVWESGHSSGDTRYMLYAHSPYIAAIGNTPFVVLFRDDGAHLARLERGNPKPHILARLPKDFALTPRIDLMPEWGGPRRTTEALRILEREKMVRALVADRGRLFAVASDGSAWSAPDWWAIELSPETGQEVARWKIPSNAWNISVIAGETWVFVEKGRVQEIGTRFAPYMDASTLLFVPSAAFGPTTTFGGGQIARCAPSLRVRPGR